MKTLPGTENRDLLILLCSGLLLTLLVRTAWQADDAYAAWRLVDNFVHGHGLRYNLDERVQTFTSMSWTFLVAAFVVVFKDIYYTSIFLSIALTLATASIVTAPFRQTLGAVIFAYTALLLSASFLDFSVGGFENPLSHFLLACFALIFFRGNFDSRLIFRTLFLLAGCGGLTRLDLLAYFAGPLAFAARSSQLSRREKLIGLACWALPIALWHSFTLFYFGFPLQNAAYAKRFNNLPLGEYLRAGVDY